MTFDQAILQLEPADIQKALGCPSSTANSWKQGRRQPPSWVQKLVLPSLKKSALRKKKVEPEK
jgi:hypothetical protein